MRGPELRRHRRWRRRTHLRRPLPAEARVGFAIGAGMLLATLLYELLT